jgi:hypothetical protein
MAKPRGLPHRLKLRADSPFSLMVEPAHRIDISGMQVMPRFAFIAQRSAW